MDVLASRTLTNQTTGKNVVVSLARPEKISAHEWRCGFQIEGIAPQQLHYAYGLDAFQALMMALEGIHCMLSSDNHDRQLTWEGGELGDIGFPRLVPAAYGI